MSVNIQPALALSQAVPELAFQTQSINTSVHGQNYMIVSAHEDATRAAQRILGQGGNMVDAAIAAQLVLGLVEPQSSGIGGGGFLLSFDGQKTQFFDGRETAPAAVDEHLFIKPDGAAMAFFEAAVGGRSVGVPGLIAMLELAHQEQGKLPWAQLFAPAIRLAKAGFSISPRLHYLLENDPYLRQNPNAFAYFYTPDGAAKLAGTRLKNKAYARTLQSIARHGSVGLLQGELAQQMVVAVQQDNNTGQLSLEDLVQYRAVLRDPLCFNYKHYTICGPNAPSSGALAVAQILGILKYTPIAQKQPFSAKAIHLFNEASRLAFADRNAYVADPDFIKVPVDALLNETYLKSRAALIHVDQILPKTEAGLADQPLFSGYYNSGSPEQISTTHLSIVDSKGHAVSLTSSIENQFGSRLMVNGFLLNNQLTDFSFTPTNHNGLVANRVAAGKRPRSSMSPLLVFDEKGTLTMVLGSPGGSLIISYVAQTLLHLIDWKQDPQQAVNAGHTFIGEYPSIRLEAGYAWNKETIDQLIHMGYRIENYPMTSGLGVIVKGNKGWIGAIDPRREGSIATLSPSTHQPLILGGHSHPTQTPP